MTRKIYKTGKTPDLEKTTRENRRSVVYHLSEDLSKRVKLKEKCFANKGNRLARTLINI